MIIYTHLTWLNDSKHQVNGHHLCRFCVYPYTNIAVLALWLIHTCAHSSWGATTKLCKGERAARQKIKEEKTFQVEIFSGHDCWAPDVPLRLWNPSSQNGFPPWFSNIRELCGTPLALIPTTQFDSPIYSNFLSDMSRRCWVSQCLIGPVHQQPMGSL